jgi:hypothetical protein
MVLNHFALDCFLAIGCDLNLNDDSDHCDLCIFKGEYQEFETNGL